MQFLLLREDDKEDEVMFIRNVRLNHLQLKNQLVELYADENILQYHFIVTLLDARGMKEEGSDVGVSKEIYSNFFIELFASRTVGRVDKVPCVRHDITKIEWDAVARILIAAMKVNCYLLSLSLAFLISTLSGEKELNDDILMVLLRNYISLEVDETVEAMLLESEDGNEELLEMLSFYNCFKKPTRENLRAIILELAHQKIVQKPKYIANCFKEILLSSRCDQILKSLEKY